MAEWLCSGLQSRGRRFDSDLSLQNLAIHCPGGGIGRHKGLKIPRLNGRAGSIPAPGTIKNSKNYSKLIPSIGRLIVGDKKPYEYLVESIRKFVNQDELIDLMKKNGFEKCTYRNLSGGIVSIHSGWKI